MSQSKIEVRTPDGVMDVYLHGPASSGPAPTVILYADAGGVRASMHVLAEQVAARGYLVVLPNVLYRAGNFAPFDVKTVFTDPVERARLGEVVKKADNASVMRDTGALFEALDKMPAARAERVGCFGYCFGGRLAFVAAGTYPTRVAAMASFHGGHLVTDREDSPHLLAKNIKAKVYLGVADQDASCDEAAQGKLREVLGEAHVRYELELYAGAHHGFAVTDLPAYDPQAEAKHWERLFALFGEVLSAA